MNIINMRAGNYTVPVMLQADKGRIYFQFPYNKHLLAEIKCMKGRRWHNYDDPPRKLWSVPDCARNRFQIAYLAGKNPYAKYDTPLKEVKPNRNCLYAHQITMFQHCITRLESLISGEMGVGKTLAAIEALEYLNHSQIVWVGTGSSLAAVKVDFKKWKSPLTPLFLTYTKFRMLVNNNDLPIPEAIVFDECQKLKTHNSEQSKAAITLTEAMREKFDEPFILGMSGAPAPNKPTDWWNLCEVACPGYIKEGDIFKFRDRLAIMEENTSLSGQTFLKVVSWLDDETKCAKCGKLREEHDPLVSHTWVPSNNEVEYLYKRMLGLNIVFFKKDCLDLPELQYRVIKVAPSDLMKKAEQLILKTTPRAVTALLKLRELSDGFQYKETETGEQETCDLCHGSKTAIEWFDPDYPEEYPSDEAVESGRCKEREIACYHCEGKGVQEKVKRVASKLECPKDKVLKDVLSDHEDVGRLVVYAGFQASVDRCIDICLKLGWHVIRADGRGWTYFLNDDGDQLKMSKEGMLETFQDTKTNFCKLVFIGQAGAAGTGLTLTASPSIFFFSNSFNGDDRIQAINRIHRPGMDINRGATIIDCVHLNTDQYVLDSLNAKIDLLHMSMGKFRKAVLDGN